MKNLILTLFISHLALFVFGQDSLWEAKSIELHEFNYPTCNLWGEAWADTEFDKEYKFLLDSLASFISSNKQAQFQIRVHSDARGSDSMNIVVTQQKADGLKRRLVERGVDVAQIESIGIGALFPREVWLRDSTYFSVNPNDPSAIRLILTEEYINSFRASNKERFERLHALNRRTILMVSEVNYDLQSEVNRTLYLRELYAGHQVEVITAGQIKNKDTLILINEGDLYLHLVAPGTENEFTIRSLERDEVYSYNKWKSGIEKIVDFHNAAGAYEIELFGDGGSGKMILEIRSFR